MTEQLQNIVPYVSLAAGLLFILERFFPLRATHFSLFRRLILNIAFSALTFIVALLFIRPIVNAIFSLPSQNTFGILSLLAIDSPFRWLLAFLLLDLSFYYWHRANHHFSFLWRFHNVHHFDGDLDVSTGARFHPIEVFFSGGFRVIQILIIGVTLREYLLYELFFQFATFFHHSNLRLPTAVDSLLSKIIVTPKVHGIHHSHYQNETNSNYSVIFSFWDRLHRSFNYNTSVEEIVVGVPGYPHSKYDTIKNSLVAPFQEQNDYWKDSTGKSYRSRSKTGENNE